MADVLELLIRAVTEQDGGLQKIDDAVKRIGSNSGLTGQALQNMQSTVRKAFEQMAAAGLTFDQSIQRIAKSGEDLGRGVGGAAKAIQKELKDAADAAKNIEKVRKDAAAALNSQRQQEQKAQKDAAGALKSNLSSANDLKSTIANPIDAASNAATKLLSALGPVGIGIVGVGAAAALTAKAMFDLVDSQGAAAQETVNMANQLGISAGAMKKLQVEGELIGVSFATMQQASRALSLMPSKIQSGQGSARPQPCEISVFPRRH